LNSLSSEELNDVLLAVMAAERAVVCGLLDGAGGPPVLEYGLLEVLREVRSRPPVEPPTAAMGHVEGFYDYFYLCTHVVYAVNGFNGHLPNCREDMPWLYAYLERCIAFLLRAAAAACAEAPIDGYGPDAVDMISEAVDCICGLGEESETEDVQRAVAWLLSRQESDGFFWSPGAERPPSDEYSALHPTWAALAALHLDRVPGDASPRCAAWTAHARQALVDAGFSTPPPAAVA